MSLGQDIAEAVRVLDAIGFDIGTYHVSVWRAVLVALVGIAVFIAGRLLNALVRRFFRRMHRLDATQQLLGEKISGILVWIGLSLVAIDFLGISLTALTVFSGAFGLAVGFGLQKTFGNLISGIILLMDRSIKPGDVIAVGTGADKMVGQVSRIGIRAVSVTTRDHIEFLIPNELLMTNQVENWSYSSREVRLHFPVTVAHGSDVGLVERLMLEAVEGNSRVLRKPAPSIWLAEFTPAGMVFQYQLWVEDPEAGIGNIRSDLLKKLWQLFHDHGIELAKTAAPATEAARFAPGSTPGAPAEKPAKPAPARARRKSAKQT